MRLLPTVSLLLFLLSQAIQAQSEPIQENNQELEQMFKGDQEDRNKDWFRNGDRDPTLAQIKALQQADRKRHQRVLGLIREEKLVTGPDYYHAAMILQHSVENKYFLLGHILATISILKGHEPGKWLFAASLDRYLQRVDQPQIFGTQWHYGPEEPRTFTMEPYSRELLTDAIRQEFNVVTLAEQGERTEKLNQGFRP